VTQHAFGSDDDSAEPKWRHFGSGTDSTEPPQRCASIWMSCFLFADNQLRQNTHLSVPTTYVASLSARTEREKCGWVESSSPQCLAGDRAVLGAVEDPRFQSPRPLGSSVGCVESLEHTMDGADLVCSEDSTHPTSLLAEPKVNRWCLTRP